jgi:molybdate transport system substrate-binding protein
MRAEQSGALWRGQRAPLVGAGAAGFLLLALAASGCRQPETRDRVVVVLAAISLTEPMQVLASRFQSETGTTVTLDLAGSNALASRILSGTPADVFISADDVEMARVSTAGLLDEGSRVPLLSNRLVAIVPAASHLRVSVPADLVGRDVTRCAIADPSGVPAGRYAAAYLRARGVWPSLEPRLVFFPHVRAVASAVEQGAADLGFVYRTDAQVAKRARVALEIDEDPRWTVSYPLAILRRAPNAPGARQWAAFLQRRESRQVFEDAGFVWKGPGTP